MDNLSEITLIEILQIIKKNIFKIILIGVLTALAAMFFTIGLIKPKYQSTVKMAAIKGTEVNITYSDVQISTQLVNDCVEILKSNEIIHEVIAKLNLPYSSSALMSNILVRAPEKTRVLVITVTDTDPQRACDIANVLYEVSSRKIIETLQIDAVNIFDSPTVPTSPSSPNIPQNTVLGAFLGSVLMIIILIISRITNNKITTIEDVERYLSLSVLAAIPLIENIENKKKTLKKSAKRKFING